MTITPIFKKNSKKRTLGPRTMGKMGKMSFDQKEKNDSQRSAPRSKK